MLGGVFTECSVGGGHDTGARSVSDVGVSTMTLLCVVPIVYNKLKRGRMASYTINWWWRYEWKLEHILRTEEILVSGCVFWVRLVLVCRSAIIVECVYSNNFDSFLIFIIISNLNEWTRFVLSWKQNVNLFLSCSLASSSFHQKANNEDILMKIWKY